MNCPEIGSVGRSYISGYQKGRGKGSWKSREDERLQRDADIEARYRAPASATTINSTAFIFCLSLYILEENH